MIVYCRWKSAISAHIKCGVGIMIPMLVSATNSAIRAVLETIITLPQAKRVFGCVPL